MNPIPGVIAFNILLKKACYLQKFATKIIERIF